MLSGIVSVGTRLIIIFKWVNLGLFIFIFTHFYHILHLNYTYASAGFELGSSE